MALLFQTICSVRRLSKSLRLQNTSSMFKIISVRTASCQVLQLAAFRANVSMSNTQEGITLPIPSRREAGREILRETFRLPRSTAARWENKQWTFSGPVLSRSARGGETSSVYFFPSTCSPGIPSGSYRGQCNKKKTGKDTVYRRRYAGPVVIANPRLRCEISRRSEKAKRPGTSNKWQDLALHFISSSTRRWSRVHSRSERLLVFEDLRRGNVKNQTRLLFTAVLRIKFIREVIFFIIQWSTD